VTSEGFWEDSDVFIFTATVTSSYPPDAVTEAGQLWICDGVTGYSFSHAISPAVKPGSEAGSLYLYLLSCKESQHPVTLSLL
jgi:hypothetical protein